MPSKPAANKIQPTVGSVEDFLSTIMPERKRTDSFVLMEMMRLASNTAPALWSNSFIGFGTKRHVSELTGRESEWMRIGFAPRKANFSIYLGALIETHAEALAKLGKYKTGLGCLYVNKLADIDLGILRDMIQTGWKDAAAGT